MINAALLHSISYSGSWGQAYLPLDDFLDKAAELGFTGVMLAAKRPHLSPLDWDEQGRSRLRRRIEHHGFVSVCIAGYTNWTADLEHGEIPQREMQIAHVVSLGELARDLGGSLVRIFTGYENPAATLPAQHRVIVDSIREAADRVAPFGVTLGVQNHHDLACGTDAFRDLIQEIDRPNCLAMFDAWAPALHGENIIAAARKMARITVHTTIASYQLRPRYRYVPALVNYERLTPSVQAVPMEEGFIDYDGFLTALCEGGYKGGAAYEMCSPIAGGGSLENLDRYARSFLEYLRQHANYFGATAPVSSKR